MGFNCGIVGLPNVGKSTLFNALTRAKAASENYPFCTIDPNKGIVTVPDERLEFLTQAMDSESTVPTTIEFVDIAGLVKGASKGEGLGNQFLGHIRSVDAWAHVVRCFDDEDVIHVHGNVDPLRDLEIIHTELILADLESVTKRLERNAKLIKGGDKEALKQNEVLEKIQTALNDGQMASDVELDDDQKILVGDVSLITLKPFFFVCNVDEEGLQNDPESMKPVLDWATSKSVPVVKICGKLESELVEVEDDERAEMLEGYGLKYSGLELMAKTGYELLGLITYFTAGKKETRAWTITKSTLAPQAAGVIHSDFEKGFIKAEVYHYNDLVTHKTVVSLKEAGLYRMEGKDYVVQDGDVMLFKFNVTT